MFTNYWIKQTNEKIEETIVKDLPDNSLKETQKQKNKLSSKNDKIKNKLMKKRLNFWIVYVKKKTFLKKTNEQTNKNKTAYCQKHWKLINKYKQKQNK